MRYAYPPYRATGLRWQAWKARHVAILAGYALEGPSNGGAGGAYPERRMDIGFPGIGTLRVRY